MQVMHSHFATHISKLTFHTQGERMLAWLDSKQQELQETLAAYAASF